MADNEQPSNHPAPVDPEQQRQFEQFQQFQQFLKFQESQGQLPPAQAPKQRPLWLRILLSKAVRKLAFLLVVVIGVIWAFNHYFGSSSDDDGRGVQGQAGPGLESDPGKPSSSPGGAVRALYEHAAQAQKLQFGSNQDFATFVCTLFNETGRAQFTRDFGGTDCATVVRGMDSKVAPLQVPPVFETTNKQAVVVSSCEDLRVKPGTMSLGKFTLTRFGDGWIISGHESEPDPCPTPTTSARPTSGSPTTTVTSR